MIDGVGSVELMGSVMRPTPSRIRASPQAPPRWLPRPAPGGDASSSRARSPTGPSAPMTLAPHPGAGGARAARGRRRRAAAALTGVAEAVGSGFSPASPTPLNVEIGPHRRFDWTTFDLAAIREVRGRLGGTVNDVVLAVLSGALRRFLRRRSVSVDGIDFRAMLPVNVRAAAMRSSGTVSP